MKKSDFISQANSKFLSKAAAEALEEGKGNRAIGGGSNGIAVGDVYTINGIEFRSQYFEPDGYEAEDHEGKEWGDLTSEEQAKIGVKREWFTFTTDNGDLSFTAVLGSKDMLSEDFWTGDDAQKADGFKVDMLLHTTLRTPKSFIASDCKLTDGKTEKSVLGAKIQVIATVAKTITPTGRKSFSQKTRGFKWA